MAKKSIENTLVAGQRVLIRVDFNVPLDGDQALRDLAERQVGITRDTDEDVRVVTQERPNVFAVAGTAASLGPRVFLGRCHQDSL